MDPAGSRTVPSSQQAKKFCEIATCSRHDFDGASLALAARRVAREERSMSDVAINSANQAVTKGNLTEDWPALVIG
ncbi:hypothetical protein ACVIJ6_000367 [Bradyrhizobium sp. USDA 4369]